MEAIRSLQSYWRRRTYQKLESSPATPKEAVARIAGGKRRRPSCKVAVVVRPMMRLRNKLCVPKAPGAVAGRLRDAYMNVMLRLAGDGGAAGKKKGGGVVVWDRRVPKARQRSSKGGDFEKRILVHLYNSVIDTR